VLNQTYPNIEYIIIDGQSKDATIETAESYVEKFADKKYSYRIISEPDKGIYDAMNKGIALANGTIIGIINSDDYYEPETAEKVVRFYRETDFDLMYGDLRIFGGKKDYIKKSKYTKKFNTACWNHPATFVTKKVYEENKYAVESIYDDLDFMLRARKAGYKICILNQILANFRLGGISNKKNLQKTIERVKIRNRIYKRNGCRGYRFSNFIREMAKYIFS